MKIYFIGQKGIGNVAGGVERHVEALCVRLRAAGHEVYAYARRPYVPAGKEWRGIRIIGVPSIATKHLDAVSHTFLATLHLALRRPDIIHVHSIGPSLLLWLIKLTHPRTPVVATFHSQCYQHQKWNVIARSALAWGEWMLCQFADSIIVPSRKLQRYVEIRYRRTAFYIPNGTDISRAVPTDAYRQWGLQPQGYFISVSRLVRHKGIHTLIQAYRRLQTDKKLVIVGDSAHTDAYVQELRQLAGDDPNIIFTGVLSGEELESVFAHAFAFVQPSLTEGLSVSLLEALSYGLPAVVSDIEENIEAVGTAGIIFRVSNGDDLAAKLCALETLSAAERAQLGAVARTRVAEAFNWDEIAREVEQVYVHTVVSAAAPGIVPTIH